MLRIFWNYLFSVVVLGCRLVEGSDLLLISDLLWYLVCLDLLLSAGFDVASEEFLKLVDSLPGVFKPLFGAIPGSGSFGGCNPLIYLISDVSFLVGGSLLPFILVDNSKVITVEILSVLFDSYLLDNLLN